MMLIVIRNGENLSTKAKFFVQLYQKLYPEVFYVFTSERERFTEKWFDNKVQLRSSILALFLYYVFVTIFKSPKDLRDGLMVRLWSMKRKNILIGEGFLSTLSRTLSLYFGASAQAENLMYFLKRINSPKLFLIDEFVSLKCLDIKKLKTLGHMIYVSQDIAHRRFGFADNRITRSLTFRLEQDAVSDFDAVISCSEIERLIYLQMGARKAFYYPNLYPTEGFKPDNKDEMPSMSLVLRPRWGLIAEKSLERILDALSYVESEIKIYLIGIAPKKVPINIKLQFIEFVPSKLHYLKLLSKSWIGLNVGIHMAGTNERKYDYAEAGTVVLSDSMGSRGDLFPHEYTYIDSYDLAAKIMQLLELGKENLTRMGEENRKVAFKLAETGRNRLVQTISEITVIN